MADNIMNSLLIKESSCLKYKNQWLEAHYGSSVVNSSDSSYGSLPAEPDIPQNGRIRKTAKHIEDISEMNQVNG